MYRSEHYLHIGGSRKIPFLRPPLLRLGFLRPPCVRQRPNPVIATVLASTAKNQLFSLDHTHSMPALHRLGLVATA
jgi:hypothetical protein